CVVGAYW
nr:immunoglobulin heavy chain junction region [Macaca mulatta]